MEPITVPKEREPYQSLIGRDAYDRSLVPILQRLDVERKPIETVATELNCLRIRTYRGKQWHREQVRRLLYRLGMNEQQLPDEDPRFLTALRAMAAEGLPHNQIAIRLNARGFVTRGGKQWHRHQVKRVLDRLARLARAAATPSGTAPAPDPQ